MGNNDSCYQREKDAAAAGATAAKRPTDKVPATAAAAEGADKEGKDKAAAATANGAKDNDKPGAVVTGPAAAADAAPAAVPHSGHVPAEEVKEWGTDPNARPGEPPIPFGFTRLESGPFTYYVGPMGGPDVARKSTDRGKAATAVNFSVGMNHTFAVSERQLHIDVEVVAAPKTPLDVVYGLCTHSAHTRAVCTYSLHTLHTRSPCSSMLRSPPPLSPSLCPLACSPVADCALTVR
jgi:hypothetical protein